MYKNVFLYKKTRRYLKSNYQFFDTFETKVRKIRGNCNLLIKDWLEKLKRSSAFYLFFLLLIWSKKRTLKDQLLIIIANLIVIILFFFFHFQYFKECTIMAVLNVLLPFVNFKGNAQFIFLFSPQKSGASWVFITFLQVTQKILSKHKFHWLEVIADILNFLQIFSVRKTTTRFFLNFQ